MKNAGFNMKNTVLAMKRVFYDYDKWGFQHGTWGFDYEQRRLEIQNIGKSSEETIQHINFPTENKDLTISYGIILLYLHEHISAIFHWGVWQKPAKGWAILGWQIAPQSSQKLK